MQDLGQSSKSLSGQICVRSHRHGEAIAAGRFVFEAIVMTRLLFREISRSINKELGRIWASAMS
jgi:hypothetical protein